MLQALNFKGHKKSCNLSILQYERKDNKVYTSVVNNILHVQTKGYVSSLKQITNKSKKLIGRILQIAAMLNIKVSLFLQCGWQSRVCFSKQNPTGLGLLHTRKIRSTKWRSRSKAFPVFPLSKLHVIPRLHPAMAAASKGPCSVYVCRFVAFIFVSHV